MITINRVEKETTNTLSILEFIDRKGRDHTTLFNAILADLGLELSASTSMQSYFDQHTDTELAFKRNVMWNVLQYNEARYASFVVGNEEMLQRAIVLLSCYFGTDFVWRDGLHGEWDKSQLLSFYRSTLDGIKATGGCITMWFTMDDRGDNADYEWGLSSDIVHEIEEQIDALKDIERRLVQQINAAKWGGLEQIHVDDLEEVKDVEVVTVDGSKVTTEAAATATATADTAGDNLWRYPEEGMSLGQVLQECEEMCQGLGLYVRPSTEIWRAADGTAVAEVVTGVEFWKGATATADAEEQVLLRVRPGQWLVRGTDEAEDGTVRDVLQVVVDGAEKRFIVQEYSREIRK